LLLLLPPANHGRRRINYCHSRKSSALADKINSIGIGVSMRGNPTAVRIPKAGEIVAKLPPLIAVIGSPPTFQPLPKLHPSPLLALLACSALLGLACGCPGTASSCPGGLSGAAVGLLGLGKLLPNVIPSGGGLGRPRAVALEGQDGDEAAIKSGIGSNTIVGRSRTRCPLCLRRGDGVILGISIVTINVQIHALMR